MAFNIHVVCTGNICRSPMGEIVLRHRLAGYDVVVSSSGVSAEETGNPVDRRAAHALADAGYDVPQDHCAHRATPTELENADLILAMTTGHARSLRTMLLNENIDLSKLHLWREFDGTHEIADHGAFGDGGPLAGQQRQSKRSRYSDLYSSDGDLDVPDPWYGTHTDFIETLRTVEAGADGIAQWLESNGLISRIAD